MKRKCMVCDGKGEKSIDTRTDDYIKYSGSYAHSNCYKLKLTTRKKDRMTPEDAIIEIERIKEIMKAEMDLEKLKDDFFTMLMDYYGFSLSSYHYQKVAEIVNGTRKGLHQPISYSELYEMYSNEKMRRKLEKIAFKRNITGTARFTWDLSVMVGEYEKYKQAKVKKLHEDDNVNKIIEEQKRMKKIMTKKEAEANKTEDDDVDITDLLL